MPQVGEFCRTGGQRTGLRKNRTSPPQTHTLKDKLLVSPAAMKVPTSKQEMSFNLASELHYDWGRAIAQAVSRWLPTAACRIRARLWSCRICGGQSGAGAGFLRVLRFPLPIFIPPTAPQSSIIWGWYDRPVVAAVPSGLSLTPLIILRK
jgi:hypothetical protein